MSLLAKCSLGVVRRQKSVISSDDRKIGQISQGDGSLTKIFDKIVVGDGRSLQFMVSLTVWCDAEPDVLELDLKV